MAADALSQLLANHADESILDEDLSAYTVADHHEETDGHDTEKQRLLTIQQFLLARQYDAY